MKRIKSIVANAKVTMAFFIHLHTVIIRDVKNLRNFKDLVPILTINCLLLNFLFSGKFSILCDVFFSKLMKRAL